MDLWQLHIFCKVVELASFSRAGQAIHLSQPTVSSHIKDLEQHFGCPLIDRLSRKAVPTKAGELLYAHALRLLTLREQLETAMAEFQGQYKGRLLIGGSTIPGGYLLPTMMAGFHRHYPDIRVFMQIGDSTDIVQKTLSGAIEIGFVGARFSEPHLREAILTRDVLQVIVPPEHAWAEQPSIPVAVLQKEPMIIRETGSGTLQVVKTVFEGLGLELPDQFHVIAEIGNTAGIIGGIKSGLGVSVLSTRAVEEELRNGRLKALPIQGVAIERHIYLVTDRRRSLSPLAQAFRDYVLNQIKTETDIAGSREHNGG